jgi:hypothetical protein
MSCFSVYLNQTQRSHGAAIVGDFELFLSRNMPRSFLHMEPLTISIIVISIVTFPTDYFPF